MVGEDTNPGGRNSPPLWGSENKLNRGYNQNAPLGLEPGDGLGKKNLLLL